MRWGLLLMLELLPGGCTPDYHHIYTTGSFRAIPAEGTRVAVLAEDPTVRHAVQTWLRNHDLIVLDTALLRPEAESCQGCERTAALSQARLLKAEQVLLAYLSRNTDPEQLSVSVQSLSVRNEEDQWNGMARKNISANLSGEELHTNITLLSCHVLATVWRYRPAGYLNDTGKDYCYYHF
jgi:hypothetical protein